MQALGVAVNLKMNPADFFMFEISELRLKATGQYSPMSSSSYRARIAGAESAEEELAVGEGRLATEPYRASFKD